MARKTLGQLAAMVDGELIGESATVITGVAGVLDATEGDITFVLTDRYAARLKQSKASAVVVGPDAKDTHGLPLIRVKNPDDAICQIAECFAPPRVRYEPGVHATAVIASSYADNNSHVLPHRRRHRHPSAGEHRTRGDRRCGVSHLPGRDGA